MPNLSHNLSTDDDIDVGGVVTADGFVGPLTGDATGAAADYDAYNGRALYTGPLFLPAASEWAGVVGWTPTWLTRGDEYSGAAKDRISTNDLAATGTATYDYVRGGRRGLRITANTTGFSAAVNDFANTNSVFGGWIAIDDAVAAERSVLGRYGTGRYMLVSIITSAGGGDANKVKIQATDGTTTKTLTMEKTVADGVPRLISVHIDRTMNTLRARISAPGETAVTGSVDITGWGSLTGGTGPKFSYGFADGLQNGDDCWLGGAFVAIAAARTGATLLASLHAALGAE